MGPFRNKGPQRNPGERERRKALKREAKEKLRAEGLDQDPLAQRDRFRVLVRSTAEGFKTYLPDFLAEHPNWPAEVLVDFAVYAFGLLRDHLENPEEREITWEDPFLEVRFPVALNPEGHPGPLRTEPFPVSPEDMTDEAWKRIRKVAEAGDLDQDNPLGKAVESVVDFAGEALLVQVLAGLTKGAVLVKEGSDYTATALREYTPGPPEGASDAELEAFWTNYCKTVVILGPGHETTLRLTGSRAPEPDAEPKPFTANLVLEAHPLVMDVDEQQAFYPVLAGLVLEGEGADLAVWSEEDRRGLWEKLFEGLDKVAQELRTGAEATRATTSTTGTLEPPAPPIVTKPAPERRHLQAGTSLLDQQTAAFLSHAAGFSGLPRTWKSVQRWEDLVQAELERLREELGESAFEDLRKTTGDSNARGPLLKRSYTARTKEEVVSLTAEAEEALLDSVGPRWFRRIHKDEDGVQREYLEKRLRAGSGVFTGRFSWYGRAWPLVDEGRKGEKIALEALEQRLRQGRLFEELSEEDQAALNSRLRLMESIRDAHSVMEAILAAFGRVGENPLRVPAWELRTLLECEKDRNGFRRVRGCLRALQEIRFEVTLPGTRISGPFLGEVAYVGRGPGDHGDGTFFLQISPAFVGSLGVFRTSHHKVPKVLTYAWTKELSADERKELGKRGFVQGFSLAPFWDRAKGFTPSQTSLRRWIEQELTRNKDAARWDRRSVRLKPSDPQADKPRTYGWDFCPLLPEGRFYYGALGHFSKNAECGRSLYGTPRTSTKTGGPHSAGLLSVMGYPLPRGQAKRARARTYRQALEDIRDVVEGAFQGVAVAKPRGGPWLTLEEASKLQEKDLRRVAWFFFIPPDYQERMGSDIEGYQAERHARGEVDYLVGVQNPKDSEKARSRDDVGPETLPLHARLRLAREDRGLTQADVAKLFGVSRVMVSLWEAGTEPDEDGKVHGKPISRDLVPLVECWVVTGAV